MLSQGNWIGQLGDIQNPIQFFSQFAFTTAIMRQCQQLDSDLAGDLLGELGNQSLEGAPIGRQRKEFVAIDKVHVVVFSILSDDVHDQAPKLSGSGVRSALLLQ